MKNENAQKIEKIENALHEILQAREAIDLKRVKDYSEPVEPIMITLYGIGGQTGPDMSVLVRVRPRARDNGDGGLTLSRPLVDPVDEIANTPAEAALGKPGPEPFARN